MRNYRRTLGARFSEGARLLWGVLAERSLTIAAAASQLGWVRGNLSRMLYGDSIPGVGALVEVEATFGVPVARWAEPPSVPFVPPAMRDDNSEGAA